MLEMDGAERTVPLEDGWAVVLAGGEGKRMQSLVERLLGVPRPKQYCSFDKGRSLIEQAHERATGLVSPERVVTVIGRGHGRYLERLSAPLLGQLIEQPGNHGTAAGVFLPLTYVMAADPDAVVLIFPSDHYVYPEGRFLGYAHRAAMVAKDVPGSVVLLGAIPDAPDPDFGWIDHRVGPAAARGRARSVSHFHEKPSEGLARRYFDRGMLWNTFVMAARAQALWTLGESLLPGMHRRFETLRSAVGTPAEPRALASAYRGMPHADFSRDVLEQSDDVLVVPMTGVEWNDWGRPERLEASLRRHQSLAPGVA